MLFSSPRFLVFLGGLLLILTPDYSVRRKKCLLAAASCFFYAAWDYRYLPLLLLEAGGSYAFGSAIAQARSARGRRLWLAGSVLLHVSILAYFKYAGFLIDNANWLAGSLGLRSHLGAVEIIVPAGVSFYTFKLLSYTIDVYRGEIGPCRSILDFVTFATFFPELIAGPIVRASLFLPQLGRALGPRKERLHHGVSVFVLGLTKKLVIADRLATVADPVFKSPATYCGATVWLGVVAYALQIYCDFSGYSDMAVGVAKMLGYDLPENFNMPYLSGSLTEFWRRWHMTLSYWLRDYLYIPLGGNRRGTARAYANVLATMAIGGLWHGASWNFVCWGTIHGLGLVVHRVYRRMVPEWFGVGRPLAVALTVFFVVVCWVPFRAATLQDTVTILRKLAGLGGAGVVWMPTVLILLLPVVILGHAVGALLASKGGAGWQFEAVLRWMGLEVVRDEVCGVYVLLGMGSPQAAFVSVSWGLALFFFAAAGTSPFIYFQF